MLTYQITHTGLKNEIVSSKVVFLEVQEGSPQAFSQGSKRGRPISVQGYIYSKEGGGGGGGVEKTFFWKTFEVYVTSCQYLFQARSKFFKHTRLCEFVRYASLLNYDIIFIQPGTPSNIIDQNVKCTIIMRIEAISFQIQYIKYT